MVTYVARAQRTCIFLVSWGLTGYVGQKKIQILFSQHAWLHNTPNINCTASITLSAMKQQCQSYGPMTYGIVSTKRYLSYMVEQSTIAYTTPMIADWYNDNIAVWARNSSMHVTCASGATNYTNVTFHGITRKAITCFERKYKQLYTVRWIKELEMSGQPFFYKCETHRGLGSVLKRFKQDDR